MLAYFPLLTLSSVCSQSKERKGVSTTLLCINPPPPGTTLRDPRSDTHKLEPCAGPAPEDAHLPRPARPAPVNRLAGGAAHPPGEAVRPGRAEAGLEVGVAGAAAAVHVGAAARPGEADGEEPRGAVPGAAGWAGGGEEGEEEGGGGELHRGCTGWSEGAVVSCLLSLSNEDGDAFVN